MTQTRVIRRPVRHPPLLLGDVVAARGVGLERHGGNLGSKQQPSFYPIRPTAPASRSVQQRLARPMVKAGNRKWKVTVKANWKRARSIALGKVSQSIGPPPA